MSACAAFLRSFSHAPRALARTPAASASSIVTLAVAIGATTAIFSVFYGVLLRPLPFADSDALVQLNAKASDGRLLGVSQVEMEDWDTNVRGFSSTALFGFNQFTLTGDGDPELLRGAIVSKAFFSTLGVPMQVGRGLLAEDGDTPHIVISDALWRTRFGADPNAVGRGLRLNGDLYTVVGVAPPSLLYPTSDVAIWVPLGFARRSAPPQWRMRGFRQFTLIARLRDGAPMADVQQQVDAIAQSLAQAHPQFNAGIGAVITPLRSRLTDGVRRPLTLLFVAVLFVLVVASANLANLTLARAATAQHQMAIRAAVGATQGQLVAEALAESTALAVAGTTLGTVIAMLIIAALQQWMPADMPRIQEIRVDAAALGFALVMTVLSVLLFAVGPALWASRRPAYAALRSTMPSPSGLSRVRDAVVVLEIALAVVLLIGGALLGRSLRNLMHSGSGAAHGEAVTAKLNFAGDRTDGSHPVVDRLLTELARQPEVAAAGIASSLPPNISQMRTSLSAADPAGRSEDVPVEIVAVSGGVFNALGVPLLEGRTFSDGDDAGAPSVIIVSKTASKKFFQHRPAVGSELAVFGGKEKASRVIGIVDDVKYAGMEAPSAAAIYVPHGQRRFRTQYLVVRPSAPGDATVAVIRQAVRRVDETLATSDVRAISELTTAATGRPRFQTGLLGLFALSALLLAGIGLYGVVTQSVSDRTREFAVRLSLGAAPATLFGMVMQRALLLAGAGASLGLVSGIALSRTLAAFLFGVDRLDPLSFTIAIGMAVVCAALAAMGPALRISRLDPASTLRAT